MNIQRGFIYIILGRINCATFSRTTHGRQLRQRRNQKNSTNNDLDYPVYHDKNPTSPYADDLNKPDPTVYSQNFDIKSSVLVLQNWIDQLNIENLSPKLPDIRNLANLVPNSICLQKLVQIGIDLSKIESIPGAANMLVKMDFQTSIAPKLWLLSDYGFELSNIARIVTIFPKMLKLSVDEISFRFAYFSDRGFLRKDIVKIISDQPIILSLPSIDVDRVLGEIKSTFNFEACDIINIVINASCCILQPISLTKDLFVIMTKMQGFSLPTTRQMILQYPKLILTRRRVLSQNFMHLIGRLDLPMNTIAQSPKALSSPPRILSERTNFLVLCKLFQPDGTKPLFTPLDSIVEGTDDEFCRRFAESQLELFNDYLKTL